MFLVLIGVEFGKEKQESLAGAYFVSVYSVPFFFFFPAYLEWVANPGPVFGIYRFKR